MKMLEQLSPDVQRLLISLPYRVGYFISQSDQSGGSEADEAEENALRNIVTFYVEDTVKSEFAHEVMYETLRNKAKWDAWKGDISKVPGECSAVTTSLTGVLSSKEIIAFKQNLLEIAIVVAQAYREVEANSPTMDKLKQFINRALRAIRAVLGTSNHEVVDESMLNVSPLERAAIKLLADQLHIEFKF